MENMEFDKISFDYYNNAPSYIKMIVDMLPESKLSNEKKVIIRDLYNYYLATSNDAKINEIIKVSRLFREKIALSDLNSIAKQVDYIYATFFNKIIFDSINRQAVSIDKKGLFIKSFFYPLKNVILMQKKIVFYINL